MNFEMAKVLLNDCMRHELRDHAFGDVEVFWFKGKEEIACGYFSSQHANVSITVQSNFNGVLARGLMNCGKLGHVERNDETGPEVFKIGETLEVLTLAGVRAELTSSFLTNPDILHNVSPLIRRT